MSFTTEVERLVNEIGPAANLESVYQKSDALWFFGYDQGDRVICEFDERQDKLILSAQVGKADNENKLAVYEFALAFNHMYRQTGGAKFAANGPQGEVSLILDIGQKHFDLPNFRQITKNFIQQARYWKQHLGLIGKTPEPQANNQPMGWLNV